MTNSDNNIIEIDYHGREWQVLLRGAYFGNLPDMCAHQSDVLVDDGEIGSDFSGGIFADMAQRVENLRDIVGEGPGHTGEEAQFGTVDVFARALILFFEFPLVHSDESTFLI